MKENGSSQWFRKNVLQLLTLLVVFIGAGAVYGAAQADAGTTAERVEKLGVDVGAATTERSTLRTDLRVVETKQNALGDTVRDAVTAISQLKDVTSRLEAIASGLGRPPIRSVP